MILLIEDRSERQLLFMKETGINLNHYSDIVDNIVDLKYEEFLEKFKKNTFNLERYSVIISHKSAFNDDNILMLNKLENYCKTNNKPLVLFSGGIDANYYDNSEYEIAEINSRVFYSENLKLFIDATKERKENLLILMYGKKWKLNLMINVLEKVNLFIEDIAHDKILFEKFELETNYRLLSDMELPYYRPIIEKGKITLEEVRKIALKINEYVSKVIINA